MNRSERRIYSLCVVSLIAAYSPFKQIAFVLPIIIFLLLYKNVLINKRTFLFLTSYVLIGIFYLMLNPDFLAFNFFFALLTLSPFLLLLIDLKTSISQKLLVKLAGLMTNFSFFQALIGILQILYVVVFSGQGFDEGTGDVVTGTLNLFGRDFVAGSNVMFAILQSTIAVLSYTLHRTLKLKLPSIKISAILFSWLLATVMHTIILWIATLLFIVFLTLGKFKKRSVLKYFAVGVFIIVLIAKLFPENLLGLNYFAERTLTTDEDVASTKALATINTLYFLPKEKPYQIFVGLGPGQYCSRAGLIVSGTYITSGIPFSASINADLGKYILPLWQQLLDGPDWYKSSSFFPFYSWLTLYGEYGLLGITIVVIFTWKVTKKLLRFFRKTSSPLPLGIIFIIIYIGLIGMQENYWEWSQPMLIVILFTKISYDSVDANGGS